MGKHTDSILIENRRVNDPSLTPAEYIHQRSKRPDDPHVGKVWVASNEITRIGALAHIRRALDHHKRAAEWFKNAYEAMYGGIAPAIDMGKVRVDTSIMAHDNGAVARLDNGRALREALDALGKEATDRIISCVVLCIPCEDFADTMPSGQRNQRQVAKATDGLLDALERLAEIRGLRTKGKAA